MDESSLEYPVEDVNILIRSEESRHEIMQLMIDACGYTDMGCPVCEGLRKKVQHESAMETPRRIETEVSRVVKQQFPLMDQQNFHQHRRSNSIISLDPNLNFLDDKFGMGNGLAGDTDEGLEIRGGAGGGGRDSCYSEANEKAHQEKNCYFMHDLIRQVELEPNRNHRKVFQGLKTAQLQSILGQITCKDPLFMETDGNARLLRIEQELSDLMVREENMRSASDRQSSLGGGAAHSKKSGHEHGPY